MLKNKVSLITGANRGIGKAIATKFAQNGSNLILTSRQNGNLDKFKDELESKYKINVMTFHFDLKDTSEIKKAFKKIHLKIKKIDILVNNAGILGDALTRMISSKLINEVFSINTFGIIYMTQNSLPFMIKNGGGSIINISSIIGTNGNKGQIVYSGSKSAVIGITKSSSKELAINNIRVNAIAPGFIETDMVKNLSESVFQERMESIEMKKIGTPEDIANTALFLASDLSTYVTGQIIGVDGGMLI
ncbi:MAG: 3-oxoacyl-ACP reductase FabG [Flavobacteriaceae bacterium]|jgi:3-oxoacyl-[acyl-carrier protein] reductase|nr:3-oxoacyl-ACP reductase FabG [Flavobacteriaceae bacterium]MBT5213486.1 3-oxoacyl-ACP reductase FabG [Pelagibacteraceae bacterium]MBT6170121.1 3-oxoacyl-ACP reductase FabG [Flavobacteriaceae bacterium]MBT6447134.1 3-oxoacyl-ACP reductase FabG [Flavobacteriaceae bacterium]